MRFWQLATVSTLAAASSGGALEKARPAAAAHRAFSEAEVAEAASHVVAFVRGPLDAAGKKGLAGLESAVDRFVAHGREVYWLSTVRQGESKMTLVKFERAIGQPATMRSMTSAGKLAAKHCAD